MIDIAPVDTTEADQRGELHATREISWPHVSGSLTQPIAETECGAPMKSRPGFLPGRASFFLARTEVPAMGTMIELPDGTILDFRGLPANSWQQNAEGYFSFKDGHPKPSADEVEWLHRTDEGRYVLIAFGRGESPAKATRADWVSPQDARRWLLLNQRPLPEDLEALNSAL